jgi:hypothetical protein
MIIFHLSAVIIFVIISFKEKKMLTAKDINILKELFATKEYLMKNFGTKADFFDLKQDIEGLREAVQASTLAIDGLSKNIKDLTIEYIAITAKLRRHEEWFQLIAKKVGVDLKY